MAETVMIAIVVSCAALYLGNRSLKKLRKRSDDANSCGGCGCSRPTKIGKKHNN